MPIRPTVLAIGSFLVGGGVRYGSSCITTGFGASSERCRAAVCSTCCWEGPGASLMYAAVTPIAVSRVNLSRRQPSAPRSGGILTSLLLPGRHRLPSGDDPHALPGLRVVADQWEVSPELDDAGQLATFMVGAADRFGGGFVDGKHTVQPGDGRGGGQGPPRPPVA